MSKDLNAVRPLINPVIVNNPTLSICVAADVLDLILKSTRSNRIERLTEGQVLFELEGLINTDLPRSIGISQKLKNEIDILQKSFLNEPLIMRGTIG